MIAFDSFPPKNITFVYILDVLLSMSVFILSDFFLKLSSDYRCPGIGAMAIHGPPGNVMTIDELQSSLSTGTT